MLSTSAFASVRSSRSHRRPRAIDATNIARVSDRIGRADCGEISTEGRISLRRVNGVLRSTMPHRDVAQVPAAGYSPECQSVLSAKCLTEHSSMSSEYPGGRNELSQSSPKCVLTAFRSRQTETNRKTSSSSETLLPKKCP